MKKRSFLTAAAGLGLLFTSQSAQSSTDGKAVPGSDCVRMSGGSISFYMGSIANGSSSSELQLHCPLVKDRDLINNASIRVFDRSDAFDVSCTLFSEWVSGATIFFTSEAHSTSGHSDAVKTLSYADQVTSNDYFAECSVPRVDANFGVSHIAHLYVNEYFP